MPKKPKKTKLKNIKESSKLLKVDSSWVLVVAGKTLSTFTEGIEIVVGKNPNTETVLPREILNLKVFPTKLTIAKNSYYRRTTGNSFIYIGDNAYDTVGAFVTDQAVNPTTITSVTAPLDLTAQVLSIASATTIIEGTTILVNETADITSGDKSATPLYVDTAIQEALLSTNTLDPVFITPSEDIALTGSVTVDSIDIPDASRVLVVSQTDPVENGIYLSDDGGAWERTTDADTVEKLYLSLTTAFNGEVGDYKCTVANDKIIDVDPITFVLQSPADISKIAVTPWNSATIYSIGDVVQYNDSATTSFYEILIAGTNNIIPSLTSPNYNQNSNVQKPKFVEVSSLGDDDKHYPVPYGTIQGALDDVISDYTVQVYKGSYTENITITGNDISIKANSPTGYPDAIINGKLIIPTSIDNTKIQGITLNNAGLLSDTVSITDAENIAFENVPFIAGINGVIVQFTGTHTGLTTFHNCNFVSGEVIIDGVSGGDCFIHGCIGELKIRIRSNCNVSIVNCTKVNILEHTAGNIEIKKCMNITGLTSTCTAANGAIHLDYCSFYDNATDTYNSISKTGDCDIRFNNVDRDISLDTVIIGSLTRTPFIPKLIYLSQGLVVCSINGDTGEPLSQVITTFDSTPNNLIRVAESMWGTGEDFGGQIYKGSDLLVDVGSGVMMPEIPPQERGFYKITGSCMRTNNAYGIGLDQDQIAYRLAIRKDYIATISTTNNRSTTYWLASADENDFPQTEVKAGNTSSTILDLESGDKIVFYLYNEGSGNFATDGFHITWSIEKIGEL